MAVMFAPIIARGVCYATHCVAQPYPSCGGMVNAYAALQQGQPPKRDNMYLEREIRIALAIGGSLRSDTVYSRR